MAETYQAQILSVDYGEETFIQLSISSQNITPEFLAICYRINQFYPAKKGIEDWKWRIPFRTSKIATDSVLSAESIAVALDGLMEEILAFEATLKAKLEVTT